MSNTKTDSEAVAAEMDRLLHIQSAEVCNPKEAPMSTESKINVAAPKGCAYETEYQKFVASMVQHCHCRANNCPCDGVLAGGPCDMVQEEEPWPSYDDEE
ncbi:MAG TPA: hypothetical protein VIT91_07615 [Chthoniobacterales bacterium]